jgi:putative flavoprotein involved in K+ transport
VNTFRGRHVHTASYRSAEEFAGRRVLVVGGGTSAVGFLLELEAVAAETIWATRRPPDFRDETELSIEGGVAAVAMADVAARSGEALPSIVSGTGLPRTRRIAAGVERGVLVSRGMFRAIEPDGVRWPDGTFSPVDAIIWATGFRPELRHLAPLNLREKKGGLTVEQGAAWLDPRLFLAGYGPTASMIGANRAGRVIARQIMAQL